MNSDVRNFINDIADNIRKAFSIEIPIENIDDIVVKMGGEIETLDPFNLDSFYDGSIIKISDTAFRIKISPLQSEERKNFTVAHEIGHLFLHMGYIINPTIWEEQDESEYRRFGQGDEEYEANEFAASFLMPKDEYLNKIFEYMENGKVNMKKVAEYFNVSVQAAINRGRFLGYLEW